MDYYRLFNSFPNKKFEILFKEKCTVNSWDLIISQDIKDIIDKNDIDGISFSPIYLINHTDKKIYPDYWIGRIYFHLDKSYYNCLSFELVSQSLMYCETYILNPLCIKRHIFKVGGNNKDVIISEFFKSILKKGRCNCYKFEKIFLPKISNQY